MGIDRDGCSIRQFSNHRSKTDEHVHRTIFENKKHFFGARVEFLLLQQSLPKCSRIYNRLRSQRKIWLGIRVQIVSGFCDVQFQIQCALYEFGTDG